MRIIQRISNYLRYFLFLLVVFPGNLSNGSNKPVYHVTNGHFEFSPVLLQQKPDEDKLILGTTYTLTEGEVISGDLLIIGGKVTVSSGAVVEKDVTLISGNLEVSGIIGGDLNGIGGTITLGESAHIKGNLNLASTYLTQSDIARIDGTVNSVISGPWTFILPGGFQLPKLNTIPPITMPKPSTPNAVNVTRDLITKVLFWWVRSFIWAALAVLATLFFPKTIQRIGAAAKKNAIVSGGLGLFTIVIAPLILFFLAITICALPISLVLGLLLLIAWIAGYISLGSETGKWLILKLKLDWANPVAAAIGTLVLTFIANGLSQFIPCVGWVISAMIGAIGLGAVILTRFGFRDYSG